jgi:hypothetical protein
MASLQNVRPDRKFDSLAPMTARTNAATAIVATLLRTAPTPRRKNRGGGGPSRPPCPSPIFTYGSKTYEILFRC